jgi:hypothetical protein
MSIDYSGHEYVNTERGSLISILDQMGETYQYRAYKPAIDEINAGCITRRTLERAIADGVYVRATASSVSTSRHEGDEQ